jgi:hypothetical protein
MTEVKIASFRIDRSKWEDFVALAESNGLTATRIIQDAIDRYLAGTYPTIEKQSRKPRSIGSREEMMLLSNQLAAAVAQIEKLASGQVALLKEVEELKRNRKVKP